MESVNIRTLKHRTSELLERVALGESVDIRCRNKSVAVIKPIEEKEGYQRPDFKHRLQTTYGSVILEEMTTELLGDERGNR